MRIGSVPVREGGNEELQVSALSKALKVQGQNIDVMEKTFQKQEEARQLQASATGKGRIIDYLA